MIRKATIMDFDAIKKLEMQVANLHLIGRPDIFKNPLEWSINKDNFEKTINHDYIIVFVYESDGKIIGHCKLDIIEPDEEDESFTTHNVCTAFIESICVDARYQNTGIGKKLFNHAKMCAKERGAVRLELCIWALNSNVKGFYENLGMSTQSYQMELIL